MESLRQDSYVSSFDAPRRADASLEVGVQVDRQVTRRVEQHDPDAQEIAASTCGWVYSLTQCWNNKPACAPRVEATPGGSMDAATTREETTTKYQILLRYTMLQHNAFLLVYLACGFTSKFGETQERPRRPHVCVGPGLWLGDAMAPAVSRASQWVRRSERRPVPTLGQRARAWTSSRRRLEQRPTLPRLLDQRG